MTKRSKTTPAPVASAPAETGSGDVVVETRRVADHILLKADGTTDDTVDEESAAGYRYSLKGATAPFDYVYGKNADMDRMLALFGARTLATNESSQVRNNPKGAGSIQEQADAVVERFALLETGKWVDRTREGVGAKTDLDKLSQAIVEVATAAGKAPKPVAEYRALLDDKGYQTKVMQVPGMREAYSRLMGRTTRSVDDII